MAEEIWVVGDEKMRTNSSWRASPTCQHSFMAMSHQSSPYFSKASFCAIWDLLRTDCVHNQNLDTPASGGPWNVLSLR